MRIEFRRLTEVSLQDLVELFNHADVRRHLPLAKGSFTTEMCAQFVSAKERIWQEHGYGPWAFFVDGRFAGWGGLQPEGPDVDLALVLHPGYWGLGIRLIREILGRAFREEGHPSVVVLLPPTRTRVRALRRMGFETDGEVVLDGVRFLRYRLEAPAVPHTPQGYAEPVRQSVVRAPDRYAPGDVPTTRLNMRDSEAAES